MRNLICLYSLNKMAASAPTSPAPTVPDYEPYKDSICSILKDDKAWACYEAGYGQWKHYGIIIRKGRVIKPYRPKQHVASRKCVESVCFQQEGEPGKEHAVTIGRTTWGDYFSMEASCEKAGFMDSMWGRVLGTFVYAPAWEELYDDGMPATLTPAELQAALAAKKEGTQPRE